MISRADPHQWLHHYTTIITTKPCQKPWRANLRDWIPVENKPKSRLRFQIIFPFFGFICCAVMYCDKNQYIAGFMQDCSIPGGGTRSENRWGCAAGHWKLDPKRSREKWNLGPKRSNSVRIGSFSTPKDHFGIGGCEKVPLRDRVQSPECQKKGVKTAAPPYHPT